MKTFCKAVRNMNVYYAARAPVYSSK